MKWTSCIGVPKYICLSVQCKRPPNVDSTLSCLNWHSSTDARRHVEWRRVKPPERQRERERYHSLCSHAHEHDEHEHEYHRRHRIWSRLRRGYPANLREATRRQRGGFHARVGQGKATADDVCGKERMGSVHNLRNLILPLSSYVAQTNRSPWSFMRSPARGRPSPTPSSMRGRWWREHSSFLHCSRASFPE